MKKVLLAILTLMETFASEAQTPLKIQNIFPGEYAAGPANLISWNGKLYFSAIDSGFGGYEMRCFDELSPIKRMNDVVPGAGWKGGVGQNEGGRSIVFNGKLYFQGGDLISSQLYAFDGVNPPAAISSPPIQISGPAWLTFLGNKLFFSCKDAGKQHLCGYDGVNPPAIYTIASAAGSGVNPAWMVPFKGKLYFSGQSATGNNLYVLDPSTGNATPVDTATLSPISLLAVGDKLYLIGKQMATGSELYSYDGVTLLRLTDLASGKKDGVLNRLALYDGKLYFGGSVDGSNFQLYNYDTQSHSAALVHTVNTSGTAEVGDLFEYKSSLYFAAKTAAAGLELWKYNSSGCNMVADIWPGTISGLYRNDVGFCVFNNHLYFTAYDGISVNELWRLNDATGIENVGWNGSVNLYPNPAISAATLEVSIPSPQSLQLSLTDGSGRQIYCSGLESLPSGKNSLSLPVQSLAAGEYFYHLSNGKGQKLASGTLIRR
jgi:ELWxxDGT repeat protein